MLPMLMSPKVPKVVTATNSVVTSAFGGILFNFLYRNLGSECVINTYRKYHGGAL